MLNYYRVARHATEIRTPRVLSPDFVNRELESGLAVLEIIGTLRIPFPENRLNPAW